MLQQGDIVIRTTMRPEDADTALLFEDHAYRIPAHLIDDVRMGCSNVLVATMYKQPWDTPESDCPDLISRLGSACEGCMEERMVGILVHDVVMKRRRRTRLRCSELCSISCEVGPDFERVAQALLRRWQEESDEGGWDLLQAEMPLGDPEYNPVFEECNFVLAKSLPREGICIYRWHPAITLQASW